jgi:hypothetical protein
VTPMQGLGYSLAVYGLVYVLLGVVVVELLRRQVFQTLDELPEERAAGGSTGDAALTPAE